MQMADRPTREAFAERAAIMEYDGGLTRVEAERAAAHCLGLCSSFCHPDETLCMVSDDGLCDAAARLNREYK